MVPVVALDPHGFAEERPGHDLAFADGGVGDQESVFT
jgi:hypothetical protein